MLTRVSLWHTPRTQVLRKDAEQAKETSDSTATELKAEIKNLNEQLTGKVSQTKQYQQLNKMLKAKNVQLKEIRARVKVLEEAAQ